MKGTSLAPSAMTGREDETDFKWASHTPNTPLEATQWSSGLQG